MGKPHLFKRDSSRMSDLELVRQYQRKGEAECLVLIMERHQAAFSGIAYRYLPEKEDAKDFGQELFLLLLKRLKDLDLDSIRSFDSYFRTILQRAALDVLRKQKSYRTHTLNFAEEREHAGAEGILKLRHLDHELLPGYLIKLNEMEDRVVRMVYLEEKSYEEIMEETGLTYNQIRGYRDRGIRKLRDLMRDDFSDYFEE